MFQSGDKVKCIETINGTWARRRCETAEVLTKDEIYTVLDYISGHSIIVNPQGDFIARGTRGIIKVTTKCGWWPAPNFELVQEVMAPVDPIQIIFDMYLRYNSDMLDLTIPPAVMIKDVIADLKLMLDQCGYEIQITPPKLAEFVLVKKS